MGLKKSSGIIFTAGGGSIPVHLYAHLGTNWVMDKVICFIPNRSLNPPMIKSIPNHSRELFNFLRIWAIWGKKAQTLKS
jgi:hypothetical protein